MPSDNTPTILRGVVQFHRNFQSLRQAQFVSESRALLWRPLPGSRESQAMCVCLFPESSLRKWYPCECASRLSYFGELPELVPYFSSDLHAPFHELSVFLYS